MFQKIEERKAVINMIYTVRLMNRGHVKDRLILFGIVRTRARVKNNKK